QAASAWQESPRLPIVPATRSPPAHQTSSAISASAHRDCSSAEHLTGIARPVQRCSPSPSFAQISSTRLLYLLPAQSNVHLFLETPRRARCWDAHYPSASAQPSHSSNCFRYSPATSIANRTAPYPKIVRALFFHVHRAPPKFPSPSTSRTSCRQSLWGSALARRPAR